MAYSKMLSELHKGMILPPGSKKHDSELKEIMKQVGKDISKEFNINIEHVTTLKNTELYEYLKNSCPEEEIHELESKRSSIKPDGGLLLVPAKNGRRYPIVMSENKKQGDGKPQASGNAIERAAKNVIWLQIWMREEEIFPFVIFARGEDFKKGSSIIDRIAVMAYFKKLNKINLHKDKYNQGGLSVFTNKEITAFSNEEIYSILYEIAKRSVYYYLSKGMI